MSLRRTPEGTLCAKSDCGKPVGPGARFYCSRSYAQRGNSKGLRTREEDRHDGHVELECRRYPVVVDQAARALEHLRGSPVVSSSGP